MPLRWGILGGTAGISRKAVAPALEESDRNVLVATASRDADGSDRPYAELLKRTDIGAVYVPLPNGLHRRWTEAAFAAGKHVLCEKPLGLNEAEAMAMFAAADAADRWLIEAYMTPFHPRTQWMERRVAEGMLGELRYIHTAFTHTLAITRPTDHRLDPVLGRGASLDVGIYCVAPMLHATGREPEDVAAAATLHAPRTDRSLSAFLDFGEGVSGAFEVSFEVPARQLLDVVGTEGRVTYLQAFNPLGASTELELAHADGPFETVAFEGMSAYLGMVDHVSDVILRDVPVRFGRDGSLAVARTLDRVRVAAGVDPD